MRVVMLSLWSIEIGNKKSGTHKDKEDNYVKKITTTANYIKWNNFIVNHFGSRERIILNQFQLPATEAC